MITYYETGDYIQLEGNIVSATQFNIYLSSDPVTSNQKTSPSNMMNAIICALLGVILAVIIVLIKEYWFKTEKIYPLKKLSEEDQLRAYKHDVSGNVWILYVTRDLLEILWNTNDVHWKVW